MAAALWIQTSSLRGAPFQMLNGGSQWHEVAHPAHDHPSKEKQLLQWERNDPKHDANHKGLAKRDCLQLRKKWE